MSSRRSRRSRRVYRDHRGPDRVIYEDRYIPGQTIRRVNYNPYLENAKGSPVRMKERVSASRRRPRVQSSRASGRWLGYTPRKVSGFGRRYMRFLYGKAGGGSGRRFARRHLCGK